jgi:hypothetical protein
MRSLNWEEYFYYKEGNLFWRITLNNRAKKDKQAGHKHNSGYIHVQVNKKSYKVHRIVYEMHFGVISENFIVDHKDGDKSNNTIENLRLATPSQNLFNSLATSRNKTGFKGVRYSNTYGGYYAQIMLNGKQKHLGVYSSAELASEAYNKAAKDLQGEFNVLYRNSK